VKAPVLAAALLAAVLTAGCSAGSESPDPTAAVSDAADVGWSPCDGLDAAQVGRFAGEQLAEQTGTADQPRCAFTPVAKGGPAFDVNYLFFDGGLDEAWRTMGEVQGRVSRIDVPGADAARLVVHARRPAVLVTGFVQSGGLVQSVNAVQLRPYDEQRVVEATRQLLAALVRAAPTGDAEPAEVR
jgi:hypothetical protein